MESQPARHSYTNPTCTRVEDIVVKESRRPCTRLEEVPVDHEYTDRLIALLESHGASFTRLYTRNYLKQHPNRRTTHAEYSAYEITFPEGTERAYKLRFRQTSPFIVYFPDGFELHGSVLYPLQKVGGTPITVLHLPKD